MNRIKDFVTNLKLVELIFGEANINADKLAAAFLFSCLIVMALILLGFLFYIMIQLIGVIGMISVVAVFASMLIFVYRIVLRNH